MKDNQVKIFIAELIGTLVLVLGGCGTAVLATGAFPLGDKGAGASVGILGVSLAFGLTVLVMAYAIGPISGCHINPAITLAMVIAKKTKASMIPIYWIAQITGGVIGALIIKIVASGVKGWNIKDVGFATNGYGEFSPGGFSLMAVGVAEVVLTALFVLVVVHTTRKDFAVGFGGLAAGLMLTLVHLISIPVSNTSVNPARSFGVALFKGGDALSQVWAFAVFPLIGAIIGAIIATYVLNEDKSTGMKNAKANA
jgi:aquaporin Z